MMYTVILTDKEEVQLMILDEGFSSSFNGTQGIFENLTQGRRGGGGRLATWGLALLLLANI